MKNILLLIHDDGGQEARLQAALDVTRAVSGHLTCLDVRVVQAIPTDALGIDPGAALLEEEKQREAANRALLEKRLAVEDVSWEWVDTTGFLAPCLEEAATLADLIVVNRALESFPIPDMRSVTAELILSAGKPILAVPETAGGIDVCGHALVAWDGSRPAMAALEAAVPLLQLARAVTLMQIDDGSVTTQAEEAAAYLSRHDVRCEIERTSGDAGEMLFDQSICGVFAYLVMGGFGHSRFVETVFGGVTRKMLRQSPIPLLLAH